MRESQIEKHFCARVKEFGGEVRKVQWIGRRGAPDRRMMLPGYCCWVELKAPGKKLSAHQAREHARMQAQGEEVHTFWSTNTIDAFFDLLASNKEEAWHVGPRAS